MAKANPTWKVLPHGPIEKITENLWRVEGELGSMPLKRVMTIARRVDGSLIIHNAMALGEKEMAEIEGLGPISHLVVPSGFHRMDAPAFKARYPQAKVLCPRGGREKVSEVVPVDGIYEELPPDDAVTLTTLEGVGALEGVMLVRSADGATVVFNDLLFNMPHLPGFQGFILKYVTQSSGSLHFSRISRFMLIKDRAALRGHLERLADTPHLRRIIVSHHELFTGDAAAALRGVMATLK